MNGSDHGPTESDFRRWRDRGDLDALGRVFDATASRLLLTALRLGFDDATACDLVQQTFLVAIEDPRRWDAERAVLPWLAGVLALEGRRLRRDLGRSHDPDGLPRERVAADPVERASQREIGESAEAVIAELPAEQRTVLVLHLLHGLKPVEIGRALEVPAPTVRTRLHRGLKVLRARLGATAAERPALLCALGLNATGLQGLSEIRASTLRHASAHRVLPTPRVGGVASSWTAPAVRLLLVASVVVGGVGFAGLWQGGILDGEPAEVRPVAGADPQMHAGTSGQDASDSSVVGGGSGVPKRKKVRIGLEPPPEPEVRVRVLEAHGRPADGVLVVRTLRKGGDLPSATSSGFLTDTAGEVSVPLPDHDPDAQAAEECSVAVVAPGVPRMRRRLDLDDPPMSLADFRLPPTGAVEILLVDPAGRPVEQIGSPLSLYSEGDLHRGHAFPPQACGAQAGATAEERHESGAVRISDGRAFWPHCGLGRRYRISLRSPDWHLHGRADGWSEWFEGPSRQGERAKVVLALRRAVRLVGRFAWSPCPETADPSSLNAEVLRDGRPWTPVDCVRRGEDGFVVALPEDMDSLEVTALRLRGVLPDGLSGLSAAVPLRIRPGTGRHELGILHLDLPPRIASGRVVDGEGRPLDCQSLRPLSLRHEPVGLKWEGTVRPVEGGRFEIRGRDDSRLRLLRIEGEHVTLRDGSTTGRVTEPLAFGPGDHDLVLRLRTFARLQIGCVDGDGAPCRPALRLVDPGGAMLYPDVFGHEIDGVAMRSFRRVPKGTWRLDLLLPGEQRPLRSFDGVALLEARLHRPAELQRIALPGLRTISLHAVDEGGLAVEVPEGRYYVVDPHDPNLWHGQMFLGSTAHIPLRRGAPADCVVHWAGYRPVLLRDVRESQRLQLVALDPMCEPPPESVPIQRYRIEQPQIGVSEELTGATFPEAWWRRSR